MSKTQMLAQAGSESELSDDFKNFLSLNSYYDAVVTPNEGVCALMKFAFTTGVVCGITTQTYSKRYCYEMESEARAGLENLKKGLKDPGNNWIKLKGWGLDEINPLWSNGVYRASGEGCSAQCVEPGKKTKNKM